MNFYLESSYAKRKFCTHLKVFIFDVSFKSAVKYWCWFRSAAIVCSWTLTGYDRIHTRWTRSQCNVIQNFDRGPCFDWSCDSDSMIVEHFEISFLFCILLKICWFHSGIFECFEIKMLQSCFKQNAGIPLRQQRPCFHLVSSSMSHLVTLT